MKKKSALYKTKTLNPKLTKSKKKTKSKGLSLKKTKVSAKKSSALAKKTSIKTKSSSLVKKSDLSKAPGHRRLNIKSNYPKHSGHKTELQESATNYMSKADQMRRANSKNRRIITGATVGNKTGRIVYK